ncbi:MAG: hypothetical protein ACI8Q1_000578 [Parvicella sp.]|jgi:uncharacterized protein involved in exopolysaccharide biosynthesis
MVEKKHQVIHEDEIDLIELIKEIWSRRLFIIIVTFAFFVFGLVIAFTSKVEYKASAKLMSESQKGMSPDLGGLGGLAGLAGINLDMGGGGSLTPELYPEIVKSSVFINNLINTPIYFEKIDKTISGFDYFKEFDQASLLGLIFEYTIGLPGKVKDAMSSPVEGAVNNYDLVRFTKTDWKLMQGYTDRMTVYVDSKTGVITIESEMPDPVAAAMTANHLVKNLTESIIRYKVEKAEISLQFIQERFQEAKEIYESNQSRLAVFTDRNRNISNAIIQTEYERLQNQMNIAFEVYKGLATQLEQAKIQVKEETPVFTVLEPVKIPVEKSSPNKTLILMASILLGMVSSFGLILVPTLFSRSEV